MDTSNVSSEDNEVSSLQSANSNEDLLGAGNDFSDLQTAINNAGDSLV